MNDSSIKRNDKIKKSLFKITAAGALAVTAVVVTLKHMIVSKFDLNLVGNKLYYSVVMETDTQDENSIYNTKIVLSSQFGEIESDLYLGENEGSFDGLVTNTLYDVLIQEYNGTAWVTLDKKQIRTNSDSSAKIKGIQTLGNLLTETKTLIFELDIYLKDNEIAYLKDSTNLYQVLVTNGSSNIEIENVLYTESLTFEIVLENSLVVLDSKTVYLTPYIEGYVDIEINSNLLITNHYPTISGLDYYVSLYQNNEWIDYTLTGSINLDISNTTEIKILGVYQGETTVLDSIDLNTYLYLDYIYTVFEGVETVHQIYLYNTYSNVPTIYINGNQMSLMSDYNEYYVYELILNEPTTSILFVFQTESNFIHYTITLGGE